MRDDRTSVSFLRPRLLCAFGLIMHRRQAQTMTFLVSLCVPLWLPITVFLLPEEIKKVHAYLMALQLNLGRCFTHSSCFCFSLCSVHMCVAGHVGLRIALFIT